jgi:hypothetical protein
VDGFDETTVRNDGVAPIPLAIELLGDVFWLHPGHSAVFWPQGPRVVRSKS